MQYTIINRDETPYQTIRLEGPFDLGDLERCYVEFLGCPSWSPGTGVLWDVRQCSLAKLNHESLADIAAMTRRYAARRGQGKAAWVVSADVDFGVSRMFQLRNEDDVVFRLQVFRTLEEAKRWLTAA